MRKVEVMCLAGKKWKVKLNFSFCSFLDDFFFSEKGENPLLLYLDGEGGRGNRQLTYSPPPALDLSLYASCEIFGATPPFQIWKGSARFV
jgi:hypothetical protein